eukprot:COSAG06_NODE_1717_length_8595_cov_5.706097_8_plen_77_part_00
MQARCYLSIQLREEEQWLPIEYMVDTGGGGGSMKQHTAVSSLQYLVVIMSTSITCNDYLLARLRRPACCWTSQRTF